MPVVLIILGMILFASSGSPISELAPPGGKTKDDIMISYPSNPAWERRKDK